MKNSLIEKTTIKVTLNGEELKRGRDFRFFKKKSKITISKKIKQRKNDKWEIRYISNF
jgi:hypothetical protein